MLNNPTQSAPVDVNKRLDDRWKIACEGRSTFEVTWYRNNQFLRGNHWIRIDRASNTVQPVEVPSKFPRVVVNKFGQIINDLNGFLTGERVPMHVEPTTDDREDQATADIADRFKEVFFEEAEVEEDEDELAGWCNTCGNAFLEPYYDYDKKWGAKSVPLRQCVICGWKFKKGSHDETMDCPKCAEQGILPPPPQVDEMGQEIPVEHYTDAIGEDGQVEEEEVPVGKLCNNVLSPFEVFLDNRVRHWKNHTWYFVAKRYSEEFAKQYWGSKVTIDSKEDDFSQSLKYLDQLATGLGDTQREGRMVTVKCYYELPCPEYPQGLRVVRVGRTIVEEGPLPYTYGAGNRKGKPYFNLIPVQTGDVIPGAFWRRPRADDLISPQQKLNLCYSALKATGQRMGNPVWLDPEGSGLKNVTGGMGQILRYRPVVASGSSFAEPKRVEASLGNVQPFLSIAIKTEENMEKIAGTYFLAGADVPSGVTAASALSFLGEKAVRALAQMKKKWAKAWKRWTLCAIEIMRSNVTEERIRMIRGRNNKWKAEKFLGADLQGSVNIRIDYEGILPKSEATTRATISELVRLGAVNPQDPEQQFKLLEAFGETNLRPSTNKDIEEAALEYENFMDKDEPPLLIPLVQNSVVHLMQHADDMKSEEFKELMKLNPAKAKLMLDHIQATALDVMVRRQTFMGGPQEEGGAPSDAQGSTKGSGKPAPIRKGEDAARAEASLGNLSNEIPPEEPLPVQ